MVAHVAESSPDNTRSIQYWALLGLFIIIGLAFRWIDLSLRPLHHDESIHVMFGKYFFDHPDFHFYRYNPEYHGPLLYNVLRFVYDTLGDSVWSARALIALMGSSLLFLPLLFRKYLSSGAVLWLTAALALSPTMIYWSEFVREDMFVIFGFALMLYGIFLAPSQMKSFWVVLGLVLHYSSKENIYVTLALLWMMAIADWTLRWIVTKSREPFPLTFLAPLPMAVLVLYLLLLLKMGVASGHEELQKFEMWKHVCAVAGAALVLFDLLRPCWRGEGGEQSYIYRTMVHIRTYRWECLVAFLIGGLIFVYLFTGGFRYQEGILDGLYRKGITYWLEKHQIERIKGPFLFHFYQLSWYETAFMGAVALHAIHIVINGQRWLQIAGVSVVLWAFVCGVANIPSRPEDWVEPTFILWKTLKAKDWMDIFGVVVLLAYPVLVTLNHYLRREWKLGAWGFLFSATFLTYSYLGEKVPWLSSYPLLAGLIYLPLYFDANRDSLFLKRLSESSRISQVFLWAGAAFFAVSALFIVEDYFRWQTLYPGAGEVTLKAVLSQNQIMLILSLVLSALAWADDRLNMFGKVNVGVFLLVVLSLFTVRKAYLTNFEWRQRELGYISQVHTTHEVIRVANRIREEIESFKGGKSPSVLVTGDAVWPLTWYFRDLPTYKFSANDEEKKTFDYIIQDTPASVPDGFIVQEIRLRGWWVPDFRLMSLKRFLAYSLNLQRWGDLGYSNVHLLTRKP